jgi:hypothetical protein
MKRLTAALVILSALDITLTLVFVGAGISIEFNPILAGVLTWPLPAIILYKLTLPAFIGLVLIYIDKSPVAGAFHPRGVLKILVAVMAAICLFNLSALFL